MDRAPSKITSGAYEKTWGTWSRAKAAFVAQVHADVQTPPRSESSAPAPQPAVPKKTPGKLPVEERPEIPLGRPARCRECHTRSPAGDGPCPPPAVNVSSPRLRCRFSPVHHWPVLAVHRGLGTISSRLGANAPLPSNHVSAARVIGSGQNVRCPRWSSSAPAEVYGSIHAAGTLSPRRVAWLAKLPRT